MFVPKFARRAGRGAQPLSRTWNSDGRSPRSVANIGVWPIKAKRLPDRKFRRGPLAFECCVSTAVPIECNDRAGFGPLSVADKSLRGTLMAKEREASPSANKPDRSELLSLLVNSATLQPDQLKSLLQAMDNFDVIAKVFLLEGLPFVFSKSPMKYLIFREQVADRFNVGYQDICIVGSAKLGFSPSAHKFEVPFSTTSDVDVVIISSDLFYRGTHALFEHINRIGPALNFDNRAGPVSVPAKDWRVHKEAVRNYVYDNFNPGLLPVDHSLRVEIFSNISSTSALFLALEPQVFVSKIRCRAFRNWRAAESYYTNSLRQLKLTLAGAHSEGTITFSEVDDEDDALTEAS